MSQNILNLRTIKLYALLIFTFSFLLFSCEDPVPNDYKPDVIVEVFLIVDNPIENIIIMQTQPLTNTFIYDSSLISNAIVTISTKQDSWRLTLTDDNRWHFPDTSVKILPETEYFLEIVLDDNRILTGTTTTPQRFNWRTPPKDFIQYPSDTTNMPFVDSLIFSWEAVAGMDYYLVAAVCLDTLEYGKYLPEPTDELNRRVYRFRTREESYLERSTWAFLPSTTTPIIWTFFKWFGKHKAAIYAPDPNMLKWFQQYLIKGSYDPLLNSINGGGKGCFGSASSVTKDVFLLKNQP